MPCSALSKWTKRRRIKPAAVCACRVLLAATFLFSGWVKANDPLGMSLKMGEYATALGLPQPDGMLLLGGSMGLACVEFALGLAYLLGVRRRLTALCGVALMAAMTALTLWLAVENEVKDCGCFGDVILLSNWQTFGKNVVLLGCALVLLRWHKMQRRLLGESESWLVTLPCMVGIVAYAVWCVVMLPVVDFRPYRAGTDLREAWVEALSAPPDTVRLPATFLSHRADVMDFSLLDWRTDEDRTEEVLTDEGTTLLLVAPSLADADQGCAGDVNLLCDFAREEGMNMYGLTASDTVAQARWADYTGAEYPFLRADDQLLRTMVRANPGLMLLRDGVILHKWSSWNMPDPEAMADFLRRHPAAPQTDDEEEAQGDDEEPPR